MPERRATSKSPPWSQPVSTGICGRVKSRATTRPSGSNLPMRGPAPVTGALGLGPLTGAVSDQPFRGRTTTGHSVPGYGRGRGCVLRPDLHARQCLSRSGRPGRQAVAVDLEALDGGEPAVLGQLEDAGALGGPQSEHTARDRPPVSPAHTNRHRSSASRTEMPMKIDPIWRFDCS